jgi:ankyrin repeat protein
MVTVTGLEHRSLFNHALGSRPFRDTGFLMTIAVLLEHGADPGARNSHGRTPLDWLAQAAPSVPRAAVRNLLTPGQRR